MSDSSDRLPEKVSEKGIFIVLEGTDGSGKGTQFELLAQQLHAAGHDVALFDFPQYEEPSSYFVKKYLNGDYGSAEHVGPYTGSMFYALDRYDAAAAIRDALDAGQVVLANRFTASNMAHQGTKFASAEERRGYFIWLDNLEFEMLKIPRPTLNIVLRVPAETAQKLVDQKAERYYTDKKRDLHEADLNHLKKSVEVYDDLCQLFPKDFARIDCVRSGKLLDIETVHKLVSEKVQPLLPKPRGRRADSGTAAIQQVEQVPVTNPFVEKTTAGLTVSPAGKAYLEQAVTDATGKVYAFSDKLSPVTIAAAMARLSRRGDDMRLTILDEFAHALSKDGKDKDRKDEQLLHRVITAYGDDSVQQLVGIPFVVEDASQLLTKKLEWGRLASYLEQSTRYIYYDQKDASGQYRYVVPRYLDEDTKQAYVRTMDEIFDTYSDMVHKLTDYVRERSKTPENERDGAWKGATRAQACDAARAVLPVATKTTVGIYASGQALENLIMHLLSDELPEAVETGQHVLEQARKIIPAFLERADKADRGGATVAYRANTAKAVKALAKEKLPANYPDARNEAATLIDVWPRNELDLVADMLYEHSDAPLKQLQDAVSDWPYDQKAEIFTTYMGERLNRRHKPGRAIEKAHYSWDIVCDYGLFRELQRHRMVDDLEWQQLTPRHGFEVPKLIDDAGLTDSFENCFDLALRLHGLLQQKGYQNEAQYATLLGHNMRWKVTYNAREAFHLHELRTSPQAHPAARKLLQEMHAKVAEAHPLMADAMKFVNQGEDPELSRLAAERYTQFKLQQLDQQP
jgi:thymidylate kinase/thymidylate synthase ThyX